MKFKLHRYRPSNSVDKTLSLEYMSLVVTYIGGKYSTSEVALRTGVSKRTLIRWLRDRKIVEPNRIEFPGISSRLWSERDIERLQKYKEQNYRKGRGRKKKA
jgi:MerR HTH family regulatory protein